MRKLVIAFAGIFLSGCALVDWHCTKGGQWSSYYASGDGRCTYFCADVKERYCANTPLLAEKKQRDAELAELQSNPNYQAFVAQQRQSQRANDLSLCRDFGFTDGTDGMATCLLTQSQNRREDAISDERAFNEAQQRQLDKQAADRDRAARAVQRIIDSNKTTTCNSVMTPTGVRTTCR